MRTKTIDVYGKLKLLKNEKDEKSKHRQNCRKKRNTAQKKEKRTGKLDQNRKQKEKMSIKLVCTLEHHYDTTYEQ